MLQRNKPDDFVIATGQSHSLQEFVSTAFDCVGLDWREHVSSDKQLYRPSEISENRGDASKAKEILGWQASLSMPDVVALMVRHVHEGDLIKKIS